MLLDPHTHADLLNDIDQVMERQPKATLSVVVEALKQKYQGPEGVAAIRQVFEEYLVEIASP